jgi:hypothetical protein
MKNGAAVMDQNAAPSTELAKTPDVITTADQFRGAVQRWQGSYNLLTPFTNISGLAQAHVIFSTVIPINLNPLAGEVYDGLPFLKGGQVAIAKNGLRKIAEGLGISTRLEYISVGAVHYYWHVKAIASYTGIDGKRVEREASMEWDLRDGSPRLKGWTPKQVEEGRKYGLRACETRAINAAIRECGAGVKQAYTKDELSRPFVAVRVALQPDMSDPDIKRMVTEHFVGASRALYASNQAPSPADPWADHDEPSPRQVGQGSTSSASAPAQTTAAASSAPAQGQETKAADQPPTADAVRIVDIKSTSGEKNGRPWTRFAIVDSRAEEHSTFSKTIAAAAEKFKGDRTWVEIITATSEDGRYKNLEEIIVAGSEPDLPGLENL